MPSLVELDTVEILVVVDNEVDPLSTYPNPVAKVSGGTADIAARRPLGEDDHRGDAKTELRMDGICCGAHGLSLMVTGIKGDKRHTVLFDPGPEENVWELNTKRLKANIASIEVIQLSHWHRDHSGGMLRAIRLITEAKAAKGGQQEPIIVDLHPNRPKYRGVMAKTPISMEPDPTFEEIQTAGATVEKNDAPHTILDDMFMVSGEIPRVTSYETGLRRGIRFNEYTDSWEKDELILDERFLMCNIKGKGIVVFTGCSHAGAVNVSKHALELAGGSVPLHAVVGGYHLVGPNEPNIKETVEDFKELDPKLLIAGHCSGWRAKAEIERVMPGRLAPSTVGTQFTL